MPGDKKVEVLDLQGLPSGGDSWTRTNDPIDVNDVLYRLSHATLPFDVPTTSDYRLSHATGTKDSISQHTGVGQVYFYDGLDSIQRIRIQYFMFTQKDSGSRV